MTKYTTENSLSIGGGDSYELWKVRAEEAQKESKEEIRYFLPSERFRREFMKAKVDAELCIGCALCTQTCAEVFKMEADKAVVIVDIVPKEVEVTCRQAADDCPVTAIIIE
jgi:ferredoxin